jgi:type VI secretion system protein ImpF
MAELTSLDRLQPCLLDRLTDEDPGNPQESRSQRVVNLARYKKGVVRDLEWFFNASPHLPDEVNPKYHLADYPHVVRSVLNFGARHLVGLLSPNMAELEKQMLEALQFFEPRILPQSVTLAASKERQEVQLELRGELWADPVPDHLFVRTALDLETGQCLVGDRAHG